MRESSPDISTHVAQQLAHELFGIEGSVTRLPGERDLNFLVTSAADRRYVLKIAVDPAEFSQIKRQTLCLEQLPSGPWQFPSFIRAATGPLAVEWNSPQGPLCLVRLAPYCPGVPWGSVKPNSAQLFRAWGNMLGWLDGQLANIIQPDADEEQPRVANGVRSHGEGTPPQRPFVWDLSQGVEVLLMHSPHLTGELEQDWMQQVSDVYDRHVRPHLSELPCSLIHNDANDFNVLLQRVPGQRCAWQVTGLIDFGDMIVGHTVNDLAIALAYAVLDSDDALQTASCLVQGYHQYRPLMELEVDALWGLVLLRQAVSLANAAAARQRDPGNHYLTISQRPMQRSLPRLLAINPRLATAALRTACGWSASRATTHVLQWLQSREGDLQSVLPRPAISRQPATVDFTVGSDQLRGDPTRFGYATTDVVQRALIEQGSVWGLGGYDEARLVYAGDQFATASDGHLKSSTSAFEERRTVHLGLDWFAPAKTPVIAPLDGEVVAALEIDLPLDYGGVIVLRHWTDAAIPFYSLYGHLSRDSIRRVAVGQRIFAGETFAELGDETENGGWAPHLHLQLMVDDLGMLADFPGVCRASQRALWTALSPDPAHLFPANVLPIHDRQSGTRESLAQRRRHRFGGCVRLSYREPIEMVRGWMQYLYDANGRRFLDAYNNVPHVGHCHPRVVEAVSRQLRLLNTNTRYLNQTVIDYADRLAACCPSPLDVCFLLNSATEANELAIRLARAATGGTDVLVTEGAYHGNTTTLIDASPYKHMGPGGSGPADWVQTVPLADDYRGPYRRATGDAGERYAADVVEAIQLLGTRGRRLAAWLAETCPSVAGQIMFPPGYLASVYLAVREAGGVTIADEVQTGLWRLGDVCFAFETEGVVPDILVVGKPLGNGMPLAAVMTTRAIAERFDQGMEFFSTFGGNPVSCAAGLAVLQVLEDEQLADRACLVGERLREGFNELQVRYEMIGDVRGRGLFWGLELVRNHETLEPADEEAEAVVEHLKASGVLISRDGLHHHVLKIRPPMPFDEANADVLCAVLDEAFNHVARWASVAG